MLVERTHLFATAYSQVTTFVSSRPEAAPVPSAILPTNPSFVLIKRGCIWAIALGLGALSSRSADLAHLVENVFAVGKVQA